MAVVVLGILSIAMLVWIDHLSRTQRAEFALADAIMDFRVRVGNTHLYLEEATAAKIGIHANPAAWQANVARALEDLREAKRLSEVLLKGGVAEYDLWVEAPIDTGYRRWAENLERLMLDWEQVIQERLQRPEAAYEGSNLENRMDAIFDDIQRTAEAFEKDVEEHHTSDYARSRRLVVGAFFAWLSIMGTSAMGLWHRERRRRAAEDALRDSERRFRAIFEQAAVGVAVVDSNSAAFVRINQRYCEIIGYTREEMLGFTFQQITHPDDLEAALSLMRQLAVGERRTFTVEQRYCRKGGATVWVNLTVSPLWDLGEDPTAHVVVVEDITTRKEAQERLEWQARVSGALADLYKPLVAPASSPLDFTHIILEHAKALTGSDHGFVSYGDPHLDEHLAYTFTEMMDVDRAANSAEGPVLFRGARDGRYPRLWDSSLNTREPFYTNAPSAHPVSGGTPGGHAPLSRFLSVPVVLGGEPVGQIAVANSAQDYTDPQLDAVRRLAEYYALAIQRKRAEENIANIAKFPSENPHPIMRLHPNGTILYANAASAGLLRIWDAAVGRSAPSPWPDMAREALATGATREIEVECADITYVFSVVPISDAGHVNLYGRDVTDRKRAEEALRKAHNHLETRVKERTEELYTTNCWLKKEIAERRRAEAELRAWFDNVPIGLYRTTRSGRIVDANPSLVRFLGFPDKDTLLATNAFGLYANAEDRKRWMALVEGEACLMGFEAQARRRDGKVIWVRNSARAVRDSEGRVLCYEGGLEDITALKQSEGELLASREQLRVLAGHLESVREEERTRMAREVHDELGQCLTGLKFDLTWLATRLPTQESHLREKTRTMSRLVEDTIKSVQRIATELRPGILDDLGLTAAIEWQTQEFQARTGIHCEFVADTVHAMEDQEQRTALFRILQETLTNVARHAHATSVVISLSKDDDCFELCVKDDGRGITDEEIADRGSLGLLGIQERARLLGGEVGIAGRPGAGTTISVRIPVDRRPAPPSPTLRNGSPAS